jgi:succinate dehydrogenase/fumarate reductase flavoprotein subunit
MGLEMANQTSQVQGKTQWKRIKIPHEAYEHVKERAHARGMPVWQYIINSMDFYESAMKNVSVSDVSKLQNASYYSMKLAMAIAEFIHKRNEESYQKAKKIIAQVRDRKHIDVSVLDKLVDMYRDRRKKSYVRAMMQELVRINILLLSGGGHE